MVGKHAHLVEQLREQLNDPDAVVFFSNGKHAEQATVAEYLRRFEIDGEVYVEYQLDLKGGTELAPWSPWSTIETEPARSSWREHMGWAPPVFPGGNRTIRRSLKLPGPWLDAGAAYLSDSDPGVSMHQYMQEYLRGRFDPSLTYIGAPDPLSKEWEQALLPPLMRYAGRDDGIRTASGIRSPEDAAAARQGMPVDDPTTRHLDELSEAHRARKVAELAASPWYARPFTVWWAMPALNLSPREAWRLIRKGRS